MKVVVVNLAFDSGLRSPEALIEAYHSLRGWSEAVQAAGASVSVVQAFHVDAQLYRSSIDYRLCRVTGSRLVLGTSVIQAVLAADADLVHLNGLDAPMQLWWLRRGLPARTAIVVQDHASLPSRAGTVKAPIRRRAMAAADGFLFTSAAQAKPWLDGGFIAEPSQVHEVLEASTALTPMNRDEARRQTGLGRGPAVLWVGRLTPNKDPLTVLTGFEQAAAELPAATLTMIFADDTLLTDVQRRIQASPVLAPRVRLVGGVPHAALAAWYSAADLFVLGSHREGSGYAAIEACACGLVPVLTDIPSFRSLTGGGAVGALWPPGESAALAAALVRVARTNLASERMRVLEHFADSLSWSAVGERAVGVYRRVIDARCRARSG